MRIIGVGVGRHTHTVMVILNNEIHHQIYAPNDIRGAEQVINLLSDKDNVNVVFVGNRRWATPFAAYLQDRGITPYYYAVKTDPGKRGRMGSVDKLFAKIQASGMVPRPFFQEKGRQKEEQLLTTSYRLAMEYLDIANDVRELKHHLLDCLVILFPEVVKAEKTSKGNIALPVPEPQPPDLWTKKMRPVLENPNPWDLEKDERIPMEVRLLAKRSLGKAIPQELREQTMENHYRILREYDRKLEFKVKKMAELKNICANQDLVQKYGDGDIITIITAFLAWRKWPSWRELRSFCGINVTRVDAQGRPHISRVRPQIRQYLWLFATRTNAGKQIVREYDQRRVWQNANTPAGQEALAALPRNERRDFEAVKQALIEAGVISRLNNTRRIYAVLKQLWRDGLKDSKITV